MCKITQSSFFRFSYKLIFFSLAQQKIVRTHTTYKNDGKKNVKLHLREEKTTTKMKLSQKCLSTATQSAKKLFPLRYASTRIYGDTKYIYCISSKNLLFYSSSYSTHSETKKNQFTLIN